MNIIYPYQPLDYMGHRGLNPLILLLYLYYSTAIITTYEYHLSLPTFGLHGPQRPQPTYTITTVYLYYIYYYYT